MASDPETLVKDWQALLGQAKEMQLATDKFSKNLNLENDHQSGVPTKDLESYADLLKDKGDPSAILALIELISKDVMPLVHLINAKSVHSQSDESERREAPTLSPAAQAIADGFDRLLQGKKDPRMSYGRIPPQHRIDSGK